MESIKPEEINDLVGTLRFYSSYNFSEYSKKSLGRRIEKLLIDYSCSFTDLLTRIASDKFFLEEVVQKITVNTTELFRHPPMWQMLDKRILPDFNQKKRINIWHAACSSGQEVYSMLILLEKHKLFEQSRIIATDINTKILQIAEKGFYTHSHLNEYTENFRQVLTEETAFQDYFQCKEKPPSITVCPKLLNKAKFMRHDLTTLSNPYPAKYDIIMCRNVLIYFNRNLQDKLFRLFYNLLQPGGFLIVGKHEALLGESGSLFEKQSHCYQKRRQETYFQWET